MVPFTWNWVIIRETTLLRSPWLVNYKILVQAFNFIIKYILPICMCMWIVVFHITVYQSGIVTDNSNPDESLNLDSLLIQLQAQVTQKWYQFGAAVGVPSDLLQQYSSYTADEGLIEVLNYWLNNHQNPTWRDVAKCYMTLDFMNWQRA